MVALGAAIDQPNSPTGFTSATTAPTTRSVSARASRDQEAATLGTRGSQLYSPQKMVAPGGRGGDGLLSYGARRRRISVPS